MGSAIQFGIYRIVLVFSLCAYLSFINAQDVWINLEGDTQDISISSWYLNQFFTANDSSVIFTDEVEAVYRDLSEVVYKPYSTFTDKQEYLDFLLPTIESVRALETDYYRDEHLEVWISGSYLFYKIKASKYTSEKDFSGIPASERIEKKLDDENLFVSKENPGYSEIPEGVIFIYHDSVGFNKIVADDIEEDYFKLLLSRYTFDASMNDSIFGDDFKLKQKKFLDFFDENISVLSQIQYSDKDKAEYYISSLRSGALVLLLNLDMRKIDLYRNSGNEKLADELEQKLFKSNKSMAISFIDSAVFTFCKVYIADAKSRSLIIDGKRDGVFLNSNLEVDSTIRMEEEFFLFARKGQVFETQMKDQTNPKLKEVTSTPVVQDALVIYDLENTQIMNPFPTYVREASAIFKGSGKGKKKKQAIEKDDQVGFDSEKELYNYLLGVYGFEDLEKSKLNLSLALNNNFIRYYNNTFNSNIPDYRNLQWRNSSIWQSGTWKKNPFIHQNMRTNWPNTPGDALPKTNWPNYNFPNTGFDRYQKQSNPNSNPY